MSGNWQAGSVLLMMIATGSLSACPIARTGPCGGRAGAGRRRPGGAATPAERLSWAPGRLSAFRPGHRPRHGPSGRDTPMLRDCYLWRTGHGPLPNRLL